MWVVVRMKRNQPAEVFGLFDSRNEAVRWKNAQDVIQKDWVVVAVNTPPKAVLSG